MAVNPRRRRRKIDPDHAKRKATKKAAENVLSVGSTVAKAALIGGMGKEGWNKAAKKSKKRKVGKKSKSNSLYGDWLDSPSKAAKKKRQRITGVDERDV